MSQFAVAATVTPREEAPAKPWEAPVNFFDAARAGFAAETQVYAPGAREEAARAQLWSRHRDIERLTGKKLPRSAFMAAGDTAMGASAGDSGGDFTGDTARVEEDLGLRPAATLDDAAYEAQIDKLRLQYPSLRGVPTRQQLDKQRDDRLKRLAIEDNQQGGVGGFLGHVAGGLLDPINLMTMGIGGGGKSAVKEIIRQGVVNAGIEAAEQPLKVADARFGGPQPTAGQMAFDVAAAGVGGAVFEAGARGLGAMARRFLPAPETPALRAAQVMEDADRLDQALGDLPGEDYGRAVAALDRGEIPPLTPSRDVEGLFANAPAGQPAQAEYRGRTIWSQRFDPAQLDVAPELFQYKAGGDAEGVTQRLRGVEAWDPTSSGKVIVWETRDGRQLIADGHQRRALAQRMLEKGWDAQLDGFTFREADGWTAPEVRVIAALKNIREGSGTILDAAKILRTASKALDDGSLPVTGEFIGQARGLSRLSDQAFGAVVNKVIPERYGAEIGLMAGNRPDLHEGMVRLLKQMDPANGDEARAMIAEALQDDWVKTQGQTPDLFGHDPATSAMIARAKIAATVQRSLAKDARLYSQLVKHADAIEAGGNALARDANEAKLALDRAAMGVTARLSMRTGPIGEAMAEAAARVTKGEKVATAAKGVLDRVRKAIEAGESLDAARGAAIDPAAPSPAARALAEPFDDPNGKGAEALARPKPEDAELENNPPPGLFDDLPEAGVYERAHKALTQCAPG
ncbi:hypothetical protein [Caulobacter sp. X]|uniref:hypothetical protein n=1 Tax=Caulobacter sp. X TaxID=2048901 RepID=UPI000C159E4A|nr:hypothetical protein [Caulobacter sp. X]PIB96517.1 hypothetical protein CSW60_18590 [Caulobacter sp. X]